MKTHWPSYARRLRKRAGERISSGEYPEEEIEKAMDIPDPYSRAFAITEIWYRLKVRGMPENDLWERAMEIASQIEPEWKKEEILEKMASKGIKAGKDVSSLPDMLEERELRMKLISKIIRLSDVENMDILWSIWSEKEEKERYEILRMMVHDGLSLEKALHMAAELSDERVEMIKRYAEGRGERKKKSERRVKIAPLGDFKPKYTIALYNTYKGKADDIHFRSIARASALCYAFDLNLALIRFPFKSAEDCVERSLSSTRIGDGAEYLKELHRAGRLFLYDSIDSMNGEIVATTPYPSPDKEIKIEDIREGMVFLLGLGHEGLPKNVLERADFHLEFTGKRASLETCTAMGVLAYMLGVRNG